MAQIFNSKASEHGDDNKNLDLDLAKGTNCAISPLAKRANAARERQQVKLAAKKTTTAASGRNQATLGWPDNDPDKSERKTRIWCKMGRREKIQLFIREKREFDDLLKFFNLNNGCQHSTAEWLMANGKFERPPMCIAPCLDKCSVCLGEWKGIYLPVYEDSVVDFLFVLGLPLNIFPGKLISS